MDNRVKEIVDFTKEKWGLENYYLHTYNFYRDLNAFHETIYTLNMEWFPSHITVQEENQYNPSGTASIDFNLNTRQFEKIIFVGGKNFTKGNPFRSGQLNDIISFIENETGLLHRSQFRLKREEERKFYFESCIQEVAVSPSGRMEIELDHEGKISFFAIYGRFPSEDQVEEAKFSLTISDVEQVAKSQFKVFEFPFRKQKQFVPIYCLEEIFIAADLSKTFPFMNKSLSYKVDEPLCFPTSKNTKKRFKRTQLKFIENVTADQAFSLEPHPDLEPITESQKKNCINAVKEFMSEVYPGDSGKWCLKTLYRERDNIFAILKIINQNHRIFQRKLTLFLDPSTFKVLNYIDNKPFIEMYGDFEETERIKICSDEAFETIKNTISLKPVYVYDLEAKKYVLCGRMDSDFGVKGSNRELVKLDDYRLSKS